MLMLKLTNHTETFKYIYKQNDKIISSLLMNFIDLPQNSDILKAFNSCLFTGECRLHFVLIDGSLFDGSIVDRLTSNKNLLFIGSIGILVLIAIALNNLTYLGTFHHFYSSHIYVRL